MSAACTVCAHPLRVEIDQALLDPRNSAPSLAKKYGLTRDPILRHKKLHLAEKVSKAIEIHQRIASHLEVTATSGDLLRLYERTRTDWEAARERGDWSTAIKAVRELTRIIELQARLVLQAGEQRAKDVAGHPAFTRWVSKMTPRLCAACSREVASLCSSELGMDVAVNADPG